MTERLAFSVAEAAELLGVSDQAIYGRLNAGDMPGRRLGRRWIIPAAALRRWLDDEPQPPAPTSAEILRVVRDLEATA